LTGLDRYDWRERPGFRGAFILRDQSSGATGTNGVACFRGAGGASGTASGLATGGDDDAGTDVAAAADAGAFDAGLGRGRGIGVRAGGATVAAGALGAVASRWLGIGCDGCGAPRLPV